MSGRKSRGRRYAEAHARTEKALREGTCEKISFPSKAIALGKMRAAQEDGLPIRAVYRCRHCDRWHMTSQGQTMGVRIWRKPKEAGMPNA